MTHDVANKQWLIEVLNNAVSADFIAITGLTDTTVDLASDPDADGMSNFVEFALASNPVIADS